MTREEAVRMLIRLKDRINFEVTDSQGKMDALNMAIRALEQEPCEDAVSRQAVLNQIFYSTDNTGDVVLGSALWERIERLPSVTPQEPKTGHWIRVEGGSFIDKYVCSECKNTPSKRIVRDITWGWDFTNYCPNCGAKMVEPQESEE